MAHEWTPERVAALITLWQDGSCASDIGRRLGVTKNAVIGKAFRLQLPKRRVGTSGQQPDDEPVLRLDRLDSGMCSWPVGATDDDSFYFCGAATVSGKPYCAAHCREAYVPVDRTRKKAAVG
jgi:GcrA cell cycle regulator